jgi:ABC-type nitrate/sulfonate/bicarbonate transport system permease component
MILYGVSGGLVGVGLARLVLRNHWLTQAALRTLRLGQWLPFLILFATPDPFDLSLAVSMFCSCHYYLVATSILSLKARDTRSYVALETSLRILLFYLFSQTWLRHWNWSEFAATYQPAKGLGVLLTLVAFLFFVNWVFRSNFELAAERCGGFLNYLQRESWKSACGFLLFALSFLIFCYFVDYLWSPALFNSPLRVMETGYHLLEQGEIYGDIGVSMSELVGGLFLGGLPALLVLALFGDGRMRKLLFKLLPLSNISPIVLWLFSWVAVGWSLPAPGFLNYWHKVLLVGCLTFFPFVCALWGVRDRPLPYRILSAVEDTLPLAFVAMCFGELYAATAGLGFMMTIASATSQFDKGLAGFVMTFILLAGLSSILRWTGRKFCVAEISA